MPPFHPAVRFSPAGRSAALVTAMLLLLAARPTLQTSTRGRSPITEAMIRAHMEFLASDAMQGRGSGTDDEWRTATYIGSQLRRWGIEPLGDAAGFVQRIDSGRPRLGAVPEFSINNARFTHGREMLVQTIGRGTVTGPVVRYTRGGRVPDGAFLLLPEGETPTVAMSPAAGLLIPETPQVRATWEAAGARLPGAQGRRGAGGTAAQWRIVLSWEAYGMVAALPEGSIATLTADLQPGYTWNAIGRLPGSDPTQAAETILLTAHLDHLGVRGSGEDRIYNGADDDASGTTAVLALAEALAAGKRPRRSVIFAWFGSEEAGGAGARHFLEAPPIALAHIVANLEFEMIGRPDAAVAPHTLWLSGYERSDLGPELARHGARLVADPHPQQGFFMRSDNIQLACEGVVAQTVSSFGLHPQYHQPSDDLAHIDFAHMTESIASMLAPVLWLSNTTFKPAWRPGGKPAPGGPCRNSTP